LPSYIFIQFLCNTGYPAQYFTKLKSILKKNHTQACRKPARVRAATAAIAIVAALSAPSPMLLANPAMKCVGSSLPNSKDRDPTLQQDDQLKRSMSKSLTSG
jgi:hypothetical protein